MPIRRYDDPRILGLSLTCDGKTLFLLNLYLPNTRMTEEKEFTVYIGKISSIIAYCEEENICVMGDFSCISGSERFEDLSAKLSENVMQVCDAMKLPSATFTHANYGSLSCSWLDHYAVSKCLFDSIADC